MNQYIFHKIRPLIDEIKKNPTLETAKKLSDELSTGSCKSNLLPGRDDIVLLAILQQIPELNVRNQNEIKVYLINSVAKLIECLKIKLLVSLKTILVILLKEIYVGDANCSIRDNLSEELKLSIISCFECSFRMTEPSVVELFYVKENRILIAQVLSICVDIIDKEIYRALRIKAIECIEAVHQVHDSADASDIVLRDQIANLVFILLPKVLATLRDVATGDEKQGHVIISMAVRAMGRILWLTMEDKVENADIPSIQDIKSLVDKSKDKPKTTEEQGYNVLKLSSKAVHATDKLKQIDEKERSEEWLKAASKKLQPVMQSLQKLAGSKNERIRTELAVAVNNLLSHCSRNMATCTSALLEMKIALDEETIGKAKFNYNENLFDTIESVFIAHLIKLPRIIYTGDEEEQRANFLLLKGLIRALCSTNRLKIMLTNENTLRNLTTTLTSVVELEKSMNLLEENYSIRLVEDNIAGNQTSVQNSTPWKEYKNIRNTSLETIIRDICKLLSQHEDAKNLILDNLLSSFNANAQNCNEILVLFQFFISEPGSANSPIDTSILEELLNDTRWNLAVEANTSTKMERYGGASSWYEDRTEGLYESAISIRTTDVDMRADDAKSMSDDDLITINDVKFNVLHICLVLEAVGLYSEMLKKRFQKFLLKSLHRILEKAGSSRYMIHTAGFFALNKVTIALNLNSISTLIHANSDYISYYINISLKHADQSKYALDILNVVLQYSSLESIPHLENIVTTVLLESAKTYQSTNATSFLRVFSTLLTAIRNWTVGESKNNTETETNDEEPKGKRFKVDYDRWFQLLDKDLLNVEEEMLETEIDLETEAKQVLEANEVVEDDPAEKPKPLHINLTLKIIERCLRYLASKRQEDKIIVLEALGTGLDIIKDDENDLLPMVHKIWSPLVERIKDNSPVILRRCFHLLQKLAIYAKDFIYHRTIKEVLPFIISFLQQNSKKNPSRHEGFSYEQTQEFHLLQELLSGLPEILTNLDIQEKDLDNILEATTWLLDKNQQKTLQSNCVTFFLKMCDYDTPTVYVKLLKFKSDDRYAANVNKIYAVIERHLKKDNQ